ncbi:ATP-binding protein [Streptomyces sp. SBR177]
MEPLTDLLQAVLWLGEVPGTAGLLPSVEDVQRRLERARLLQPLRLLVRDAVHGRRRELDALRAYVALPTEPAEPPVLLHGIGGIGKSTLLARFLLDALEEAAPDGFPFACIDFERPTLSIHEPATVIAEAARQLGVQYPEQREAFESLAERCGRTAGAQRGERGRLDELSRLSATRATYGRDYSAGFTPGPAPSNRTWRASWPRWSRRRSRCRRGRWTRRSSSSSTPSRRRSTAVRRSSPGCGRCGRRCGRPIHGCGSWWRGGRRSTTRHGSSRRAPWSWRNWTSRPRSIC